MHNKMYIVRVTAVIINTFKYIEGSEVQLFHVV
jgi:hypothetical protein